MKLHLPAVLLSALMALCAICHAAATVYLPDDVQTGDAHFYDMGKGFVSWNVVSYEREEYMKGLAGAEQLWNESGSSAFLGATLYKHLESSYRDGKEFNEKAFRGRTVLDDNNVWVTTPPKEVLIGDSVLCWAYAGTNVIQYWQSEYGVFYRNAATKGELKHGYTYDKEHLGTLAGTQSLNIGMLFYDNWSDLNGDVSYALGWYMDGRYTNYGGSQLTGSAPGGYFSDYKNTFVGKTAVAQQKIGDNILTLQTHLSSLLGYSENGQVDGHIAAMSIGYTSGGGHGLTIYGYETDANDHIIKLYIADSDDDTYGLRELYVQRVENLEYIVSYADGSSATFIDDKLCLYWDSSVKEDGTRTFSNPYNGGAYIDSLYGINQSTTLQNMRAEYDTDALVWSGGDGVVWKNDSATAEADVLPTDSSGWKVEVDGTGIGEAYRGDYASYFVSTTDAARDVVFNDTASSGTVNLGEDVVVGSMSIANSTKDYTFSGNHSITADSFSKTGSGSATFTDTDLSIGGAVTLAGGSVTLNGDASLIASEGTTTLGSGATLSMDGSSSATFKSLTVDASSALNMSENSVLQADTIDLAGGTLELARPDGSNYHQALKVGTLKLSGNAALNAEGRVQMNATSVYVGDASLNLADRSRLTVNSIELEDGSRVSVSGINSYLNITESLAMKKEGMALATISQDSNEKGVATAIGHASLGVDGKGAYLRGESPTTMSELYNVHITVEEGVTFSLQDAVMSYNAINKYGVSVSGSGATSRLQVANVDAAFTKYNATVVSSASEMAAGALVVSDDAAMWTLTSNASLYVISSNVFSNLTVTGTDMTLDFTSLGTDWQNCDFLAISFTGTSFDFASGLKLTALMDGGENISLEDIYFSTGNAGARLRAVGASPATTLYFATSENSLQKLELLAIPEPTTATLSLLALAALAARRRRR